MSKYIYYDIYLETTASSTILHTSSILTVIIFLFFYFECTFMGEKNKYKNKIKYKNEKYYFHLVAVRRLFLVTDNWSPAVWFIWVCLLNTQLQTSVRRYTDYRQHVPTYIRWFFFSLSLLLCNSKDFHVYLQD